MFGLSATERLAACYADEETICGWWKEKKAISVTRYDLSLNSIHSSLELRSQPLSEALLLP
jgi:hypothetical protein